MAQSTQSVAQESAALPEPPFPFLDLKAEFAATREEVLAAVEKVLTSQHFILGPEVEALEREIAQLIGCQFGVGCASGSDALLLALMALGVGERDEVITPPFTFVATVGSIARLGARPVFVDIKPDTFNLDAEQLKNAITPRTKAIMPVHLFGLAAEMDEILETCAPRQLPVVEDAAQAIGSTYKGRAVGSLGTMGCFSFFPSKNLGGAGDGGLITTNDAGLADRLRVLRAHGSRKKYQYELVGINSRLDALQAAILRIKLRHLDEWTNARQQNADRYRQLFSGAGLDKWVGLPFNPSNRRHVYNQFVIRTARRNELREHLRKEGIPTEIYYPYPLHLEPAFKYLGYRSGDFPVTERACNEVLALPVFPTLTEEQQKRVVAAIAHFFVR